MKNSFYLFIAFLIISCSSNDSNIESSNEEINIPEHSDVIEEVEDIQEELVPIKPFDSFASAFGLELSFNGFIFSMDSTSMDPDRVNLDPIDHKNDSIYIYLDLDEQVEDVPFVLAPAQETYASFMVEQRIGFHHSISNEGPHCDMVEVAPMYTDWKEIQKVKSSEIYRTLNQNTFDTPNIEMSFENFKKQVEELCGERYLQVLGWGSGDPADYLGVSSIEFQVTATDLKGKKTKHVVIFSIPMGC